MDALMNYLDTNLGDLHKNLSADNFKHILYTIWGNLLTTLYQQMDANMKVTNSTN